MTIKKTVDKINGYAITIQMVVFFITLIYLCFFFDARVDAKIDREINNSKRMERIELNLKNLCSHEGLQYIE